jgi:hypothetical protein
MDTFAYIYIYIYIYIFVKNMHIKDTKINIHRMT